MNENNNPVIENEKDLNDVVEYGELEDSPIRGYSKKIPVSFDESGFKSSIFRSRMTRHQVDRKDLGNREKSKLACLIRKKYTSLLKESIKQKASSQKYVFCPFFRNMTKAIFYQFSGTLVQSIISLYAILIYIIGTYYSDDYTIIDNDYNIMIFIRYSELTLAVLISLDYLWNLYRAKNKFKYLINFLNILDLITIIPIYISAITSTYQSLGFVRVFRVIRVMRIFRFFKIINDANRKEDDSKNEISRRLITSILTVLGVVFLCSGIVHYLNDSFPDIFRLAIPSMDSIGCSSGANVTSIMDNTREYMKIEHICPEGDELIKIRGKITFDLAFYYMVITMATVGYGDIYPETSWMKLVIAIFVIISIITISKQTSELNDLIKLNSEYQVPFKDHNHKHIILYGFYNKSSLTRFLSEFYHIDHKEKSENVKFVIIGNEYPDKEIQSILLNPKFEENLHYYIGDIFNEKTLSNIRADCASNIFLISDQNDLNSSKNDQYLILACKAISQYTQSSIYVQFNSSQSLLHDWADWDMACSSQQIKMSIIVNNGFINGFSTMIMNLSSSSTTIYSNDIKESPWLLEYSHGASQEIYIIEVPQKFQSIKFSRFVEKAYIEYGTLIIGIKKKRYTAEDKDISYHTYLLNPIDYEVNPGDELIVISSDLEAAKIILEEIKNKKYNNSNNNFIDSELLEFLDDNIRIEKCMNKEDTTIEVNLASNISQLFLKRQHFKIWESTPSELITALNNHYLIFCKEDHLWEFMNCFDKYYSELIFFVSDQHPSTKWDVIKRYFKNLIYIECSYSDQDDLEKLNLEQARHIFILTYAVENSNVSDSGILPLVKIIEENFPNAKYTLELSDELNVRYLNNQGKEDDKKKDTKQKVSRIPVRMWPKYAKSDIFFSSSLESLLAFSYHNDGLLDVLTKILGISNGIHDSEFIENHVITLYRYIGEEKISYEELVKVFLKLNPPIIPIAVYRINKDDELKNELPYIITNPKKELHLNPFDKIICIGKTNIEFLEYSENEFHSEDEDEFLAKKYKNEKIAGKKRAPHESTNKYEDFENLNEDALLEELKLGINNLKNIIRNNGESDSKKRDSIAIIEESDNESNKDNFSSFDDEENERIDIKQNKNSERVEEKSIITNIYNNNVKIKINSMKETPEKFNRLSIIAVDTFNINPKKERVRFDI